MESYVPFVVYMAITIIGITLATSRKARCLFAAVVLCAVAFYGVFALHGAARAEAPQERTCWVSEIRLDIGGYVVVDEDDIPWFLPLGTYDIAIGEEHTLYVDFTAENQWGRTYWLDEEVDIP